MRVFDELIVVPQSKDEEKAMINAIVSKVCDEGMINPFDAEIVLKQMKKVIEGVLENQQYKDAVSKEAGKYAENKFEYKRFGLSKKFNTRYDYKGDHKWNEYNAKIKARETFLKALTEPMYDDEGIQVFPAICKKSEYIGIEPLN